jgi:UPF0716 protein FxsA
MYGVGAVLSIVAPQRRLRMLPLAALLVLPFAEIALFVLVGARLGVGWTVTLVLLAAVAGAAVIRREGVASARAFREAALAGRDPADPVADAAARLAAGVLLIAPGFLTDALALALLFPPSRRALFRLARPHVSGSVVTARGFAVRVGGRGRAEQAAASPEGSGARAGDIPIDAEYVDLTEPPAPRRGAGDAPRWTPGSGA